MKIVKTLLIVLPTALCILLFIMLQAKDTSDEKAQIGVQAVQLLYDFGTIEQLDFQMGGLKKITTGPVFNQLTIDNEERTMNTYFKFKNKSVTVEIIKATENYVFYTLHTEVLTEGRLFVFFFNVNDEGLIDWVREVEAIDFVKTLY